MAKIFPFQFFGRLIFIYFHMVKRMKTHGTFSHRFFSREIVLSPCEFIRGSNHNWNDEILSFYVLFEKKTSPIFFIRILVFFVSIWTEQQTSWLASVRFRTQNQEIGQAVERNKFLLLLLAYFILSLALRNSFCLRNFQASTFTSLL